MNEFPRIKTQKFLELRNEIVELFPTEDPDFFYIPPCSNDNNEFTSAKDSLYNYYKIVRKEFRDAGMLFTISQNDKTTRKVIILLLYINICNSFLQLEQDFHSFLVDLQKNGAIEGDLKNYMGLLSAKWPQLAKKIVSSSKKSRAKEVKKFLFDNKDLVAAGIILFNYNLHMRYLILYVQ